MDNVAGQIFEHVAAGRMDEQVAVQLLRALKQQHHASDKDIAIIGLSLRMPGANNLQQFWDNLAHGRDCIGPLPEVRQQDSLGFIRSFTPLRDEEIRFSHGGFMKGIDEFDYAFFNLSPKEAALMDPNQRLFLQAAWEAIEDAGYGGSRIQGSKTGIYLGYADWPVYGQYITKNQPSQIPMASTGNTPSIIAGRIAYLLDLQGPALLVDTACSSSLVAVHTACMALRNKECEMAITGGVKVCLMPVDGLFEIGIESTNRKTSAFDDGSDGTVWGEGTVALLLKPLRQALKDRDPIHAVIRGSAANQDGTSVGLTAPNAASQELLLSQAWEDAGIHPETIGYIEAHGTGTKLGDPIEADGIKRAFRRYTTRRQFCAIGSVKTNIGHLDAASGVAGLAKAIAALKYKQLPPTLHFTRPNRNIAFEQSPLYVSDRLEPWLTEAEQPRRCGVSSFGFSGTNCHIVLEEAPDELEVKSAQRTVEDVGASEPQLLLLSAKTRASLERLVMRYVKERSRLLQADFLDLSYTVNTGRGQYGCRLAIIADSTAGFLDQLQWVMDHGFASYEKQGIYYDEHRVVSARKEARQNGEWTAEELKARSQAMAALILRGTGAEQRMNRSVLEELAKQAIHGGVVNWDALYEGRSCSKLHLPVYAFEPSRCWIELSAETSVHAAAPSLSVNGVDGAGAIRHPLSAGAGSAASRLPQLAGRHDGSYTAIEWQLAKRWEELLGVSELSIDDDFFELGGNSILVIRMEVELEKAGISLDSELMYRYPTIREAAAYLEQLPGEGIESPRKEVDIQSTAHASFSKESNHREQTALAQTAAASELHEAPVGIEARECDNPSTSTIFMLSNIEPFNDLYYRNCFYNSLFPVVAHFGGSILPYLFNDLILYHRGDGEESGGYEIRYEEIESQESLFHQMNLNVEAQGSFTDTIEELIGSLRQGHPVIVWVDAYAIPSRKDVYQQEHVDHTLLVYGFDLAEQCFHIIEHDRRENLSYKPCTISFTDMDKACEGFKAQYQQLEHRPAYYRIIHRENARYAQPERDALRRAFASRQLEHRVQLQESMTVLQQLVAWLKQVSSTAKSLSDQIDTIIEILNQILNAKQVEGYRLLYLYGADSSLLASHRACVEHWETVRKGMVRYFYAPIYQEERITAIHARLEHLIVAEQKFLSEFINQLQFTLTHNH